MSTKRSDIIAQLQKSILPLQGFKSHLKLADAGLGIINRAFPGVSFPVGAIHEFITNGKEDVAATTGFVAGMLGSLMRSGGAVIWIGGDQTVFPPALEYFGIAPDKVIFINLYKEKEILWVMEEALKCEGLAAVVGEVSQLSFTASRRLQLAVEQSQVTGFILRSNLHTNNTTASITRWKITHLPSVLEDRMPGVGFPRWNVDLLKVRNGVPSSWQVEFVAGAFRQIPGMMSIQTELHKKTG